MIETTWLSKKNASFKDYDAQIKIYLNNLGIKDYKINYREEGAIPLFYPIKKREKKLLFGHSLDLYMGQLYSVFWL